MIEISAEDSVFGTVDMSHTRSGRLEGIATWTPGPEYICDMLAWIGTDLVECLEPEGRSCRYACSSDSSDVFCTCRVRKSMAQILRK